MRSFLASDTMLVSRFTENLIPFSFSFPVDQMPRDGQQQQQHHHHISKVQISSFCWNCQALGPGPGLCLRHFNSFTRLRLKTLDQRADAIIQMHPPTHNFSGLVFV